MSLTVGNMILAHIANYTPKMIGDNVPYVLPFDLTQDGMSIALGKGRAHIAIEAKGLLADGLVTEHLKHIAGTNGRKRKTYVITEAGRKKVSAEANIELISADPRERLKIAVSDMQTQLEEIENKLGCMKSNLCALKLKVKA